MAEERFETTEKPLETAVKMALLEDKVEATQKELERTKKQLQDAETARDRAENARKYCVEQVEQHAAKDCAKIYWHNLQYTRKIKGLTTEIDMLKKKVKVLEASNTKRQEHEKSFRCVAVNVLPQSPESATASAAFSNTLSDHGQLYLLSKRNFIYLHHYSPNNYHESSTRPRNSVSLEYSPSCPTRPRSFQDHRWPPRRERGAQKAEPGAHCKQGGPKSSSRALPEGSRHRDKGYLRGPIGVPHIGRRRKVQARQEMQVWSTPRRLLTRQHHRLGRSRLTTAVYKQASILSCYKRQMTPGGFSRKQQTRPTLSVDL